MNTPLSRRNLFGLLFVALTALWISRCGHTSTSKAPHQNPGTASTAHSVTLNWTASTSVVVGYNIYRAAQSGGPYTKLNSSLVHATNYTDTTVQAGRTYLYVVTATDAQGHESEFSNKIQAMVPSP
jgi:fibronectin type 3 domain-containing protein